MPEARRLGPVIPYEMASSLEMTPTSHMRTMKILFLSRRAAISSICSLHSARKVLTRASKPSGRSRIWPPTRVYEVVNRAPVSCSQRL